MTDFMSSTVSLAGRRRTVYVKFWVHFRLVHQEFVGDELAVGHHFLQVLRRFILPVFPIKFIIISVHSVYLSLITF